MTADTHELFVELLHEELPASMIDPVVAALRDGLLALLKGVEHGAARTWATPRRVAVLVADVAESTPLVERLMTGPAASRAFVDGVPTRAALGFARGRGVDPADLEVVDGPKGPVVGVRVTEGGERTRDVVSAGLDALVRGLPFKKSMEWGVGGVRFGRPLHRVSAVYGGEPLSGDAAGCAIGNTTVGHRLADTPELCFSSQAEWETGLRERSVIPDVAERRARIQAGLDALTDGLGADRVDDPELLNEVQHLVECPVVIGGVFDEALMGLPSRLLITSMKVHQRYFPIFERGALTHHFAVVSNNPWGDAALIAQGNARVLRARFYDARFFLEEDQRVPLTAFSKQLVKMRWIKGLGTMAQKQARLAVLAPKIAALLGASEQAASDAGRAGGQCKADLVTQMVSEFSDLQGHMGRIYAAAGGERPEVAAAIEEHYRPKGASDAVPTAPASVALALADRLDTLAGCFGVGMVPKGSGDPQGLRRAAAGVLLLLESGAARLPLADLFGQAVAVLHAQTVAEPEGFEAWAKRHGAGASLSAKDTLVDELIAFAVARFKASAVAAGATGDRVDAILAVTAPEPTLLRAKVAALERVAGTPAFEPILRTFKRVLNITASLGASVEGDGARTDPAEHALGDALDLAADAVAQASASLDFDAVLAAVLALEAPVAHFFEAVMVDDPDPQKKAARVGLLLRAATLFRTFADFTRVSTR